MNSKKICSLCYPQQQYETTNDDEPPKRCKGTVTKENRQCYNNEIGTTNYCAYHGPLCRATTKLGLPCRSMVLKFREGYVYCNIHDRIYSEQHESTRNHRTKFNSFPSQPTTESYDGLLNTQPRMIRKTTETIHNTNSFTTASDSSTTRTTSSTKTTTHEFFSSFDGMKI